MTDADLIREARDLLDKRDRFDFALIGHLAAALEERGQERDAARETLRLSQESVRFHAALANERGAQLERANAEIEKFRSFPRGEENARLETRALAAEQSRDRLRTEMEWAVKQCYRQTSPTGAICASIVQQGLNAALRAPDEGEVCKTCKGTKVLRIQAGQAPQMGTKEAPCPDCTDAAAREGGE